MNFVLLKKIIQSSFLKHVIVVFAIVVIVQMFVAQPFIVHGLSMYPTFNETRIPLSDYLIVEKIRYYFKNPDRGDVVVARGNEQRGVKPHVLKRIIGLPGETVKLQDSRVFISDVSGKMIELEEPYLNREDGAIQYKSKTTTLGQNEYYLLGDNRNYSFDSRNAGAFEREDLVGRVFVRLFPFNKITYLPGLTDI